MKNNSQYNNHHISTQQIKQMRQIRRREVLINRVRALFNFVFVLFLIFALFKAVTLKQWYLNKDAFKKANSSYLKIFGNSITPDYQILNSLRFIQLPNKPIYLLKTKPLKEQLLKLSPVNEVYVLRYWFPARLEIIIEERNPILTIAPSEKVAPIAFFTQDGKLIGREYMPLPKGIKTYKILSYGTKGDDYRKWDIKKINELENLGRTIELYSKEPVEYIDLRNPKDVYVKIKSNFLRIGELNNTTLNRVKYIQSILPEAKTLENNIKYIDLRWEEAYYIKLEGEEN